jgi:hypothetical protein
MLLMDKLSHGYFVVFTLAKVRISEQTTKCIWLFDKNSLLARAADSISNVREYR